MSAISGFCQSLNEIIEKRTIEINKETDSLVLIRDQKNKELEKIITSKEYRIKTIKDSCKYNELINSKKSTDAIYNDQSLRFKKNQEICRIENRLDSLNANQKIMLRSTMELTTKDYQKRGYPIFKDGETLHPKSYPNLKPVENLESKMKNVPSYLYLSGGSSTNDIHSKYNVDLHLPYSIENFQLFVQHNGIIINDSSMSKFESQLRNQHINRIGSYDFICSLIKKNKVFINPEAQLNDEIVEELGTKLGKGQLIIAMTKSDYVNLLSENKNKMTSQCKGIVFITEKSDFDYEHFDKWGENEVYLITIFNGQLHHSRLEFRENNGLANYSLEYPLFFECDRKNFSFNVGVKKMLKYKKFEKAIEKYNFTVIDESEKNKLLFNLGNDVRFFDRFFSYSDSLIECQNNFKIIQLKKQSIDKQFSDLEKRILSEESKYNVISNKISKEITQLSSLVNQKEERIKRMIEDEGVRQILISEADKLTDQKNHEQAISKYESAIKIRNSEDVEAKLNKTRKIYEPIKAEKDRKERQEAKEAEEREVARGLAIDEQYMKSWLTKKGYGLVRIKDRSFWPWVDDAINEGSDTRNVFSEKVYTVEITNGRLVWEEQLIIIYKYNSPCSVDKKSVFDSSVRIGPRGKQQVRSIIQAVCGE
jgi:hypothetical protein